MATILITGITGTIMGPLSALLLERGHSVIALIRPMSGIPPEKRLKNNNGSFSVITGDVRNPLAGVSDEDQAQLRGKIDAVIHGAASIKFKESPDREVWQTNVIGTKEMLRLSEKLAVPEFHFISTLYVAGDAPELAETELWKGQRLRNVYEETKAEAESLVRYYLNFPVSIYRLPIIVGDSNTGQISSFNGYYSFFAPFWRIHQILMKKHGASKIWCPVFIPCIPETPLNLVPINWIAGKLADLVEIPATNKTFQLSHNNPPTVSQVMTDSLEYIGLQGVICGKGIIIDQPQEFAGMQKAILGAIESYLPYTSKPREVFGSQVLIETLRSHGKEYNPPPEINSNLIKKLLNFAIQKKFGRRQ